MMINPHLIGYEAASLDLEVADEEEKKVSAILQIKLVEGVITILDFQGRGVQVNLYYEDDESLKRKVELIAAICGGSPSSKRNLWKVAYSRTNMKMRKVDWKIVQLMEKDARMDLQDVAKSASVSVRTVQRRLAEMKEGRAVYLIGIPNFEKVVGLVCNFLVFCPDENKKDALDKLVLSEIRRIDYYNTSSRQHSTFVVACENPSEADRTLRWLKNLDGVESVRMGIMKESISVDDWIEGVIQKRAT